MHEKKPSCAPACLFVRVFEKTTVAAFVSQQSAGGILMTQAEKERKNRGKSEARQHGTGDLYGEWPAPADVVSGFGGDPDKAEHKQWISKQGAPGPK